MLNWSRLRLPFEFLTPSPMPILLILLVLVACLPVPWPEPYFGLGPTESLLATAILTLTPPLLAVVLSLWVVGALRRCPDARSVVATRYVRARKLLGFVNLGCTAVAVLVFGWGWTVWHSFLVNGVLAPGAELLVPAPYFTALVLGWVAYFPAERALHRTGRRNAEAYWSLPGYVFFHLRQFLLIVGLPVGLCAAQQSLTRVAPNLVATDAYQLGFVLAFVAVFLFLPRVLKPALGLRTLPPGPIRDRLEATAKRLGIRYTDLLVWPTRGAVANAMVAGVIPWARYVVFTDRLLEGLTPDELDAVFGHEAGHVRHRHIPYYAGFLVLSAAAATGVAIAADKLLAEFGWTLPAEWSGWAAVPLLALAGAYLFVVFGLLSRRCEQQADVYGCRAGSCLNPRCQGHDETTVLAPNGRGLCPTGVGALVRALDRVSDLNGGDGPAARASWGVMKRAWAWMKAWQHGPVSARIEFLLRLSENVALGDRVDQHSLRFRIGLGIALMAVVALLSTIVGWSEMWRLM